MDQGETESTLSIIGRDEELFASDVMGCEHELTSEISGASCLVLGGAGSIGQAVTKELFKRSPRKLHVVDISENNLVELVRDIRSSYGYMSGEFKTFALDIGSPEFDAYFNSVGGFDFVLNLSALKHVRSEKDPYTLMRMIKVNVLDTDKTIESAVEGGAKKYFCVSTDKATNPVNMMGASKRIMEMFLMRRSFEIDISTARFANVAFSDGSLLCGFEQRIKKRQPIVAPNDVRRYFITPKESGELCLMSCILGENRDVYFPKLSDSLHLVSFQDIAHRFLEKNGYEAHVCDSEDEARSSVDELAKQGRWPCIFAASDTTGEKDYEEFYTEDAKLDLDRFPNIGIIKNDPDFDSSLVERFAGEVKQFRDAGVWEKEQLVDLFRKVVPEFGYKDTGKYLDSKM